VLRDVHERAGGQRGVGRDDQHVRISHEFDGLERPVW
jgi:hypothetical protein